MSWTSNPGGNGLKVPPNVEAEVEGPKGQGYHSRPCRTPTITKIMTDLRDFPAVG
jgi:hypothetical protein